MRASILLALLLAAPPALAFDDIKPLPSPSTSGKVMTSDGTNWTSASPAAPVSDIVRPSALGLAVRNTTGGTLAVGTLVYVSSWSAASSLPLVSKADADVAGAVAVYVVDVAIGNNANGVVGRTYLLTAQDTSTATAVGDPVYESTTAGGYVIAAPAAIDARVHPVGRVTVKDAAVGAIQFDLASEPTTAKLANSTITVLGTVSVDTAFSFTAGDLQTVTIDADKIYSASGMSATLTRTISIIFTASGARVLSWDADWKWIGVKPSALATGVLGILVLTNYGSADTSVIASWSELGAG